MLPGVICYEVVVAATAPSTKLAQIQDRIGSRKVRSSPKPALFFFPEHSCVYGLQNKENLLSVSLIEYGLEGDARARV